MTEETRVVARNRKARHDYHILESIEMGLVLLGSEIKSLREGKASLVGSYAQFDGNLELWVHGMHIAEYALARDNHEPLRPRKLLAHRRELRKIRRRVEEKGVTLIPLDVHITPRGIAKMQIGLCRGKTNYDKRADIADRDGRRKIEAAMKHALRER
ncbi:MAG TPA: SsrA-binding protein SmpB [Candidatus Sabulitectum sp.]|nr:SsrA-binding protein SmpB [Candidatus Sabulitectum sp.]HPJ27566.1 SsrA-binding protein SmpB [Candidatus Sabulitectum sp.]HPR21568.1 SsrA-binding protein SmpB [Candidatus Sabulitectum sp.]